MAKAFGDLGIPTEEFLSQIKETKDKIDGIAIFLF